MKRHLGPAAHALLAYAPIHFAAQALHQAPARLAKGRAENDDTGPDAAKKYAARHFPLSASKASSLKKLLRCQRIHDGLRPLCHGTPTKRERTIARKQQNRRAA